ncbi:aldo/keto reductase [Streptomyces sp. NPDC090499]|uniref:aldo/keto reductase n=1 Tax=unclassified Streptomyces TaxID=2593676 RepID=UPI00381CF8CE
MHSNPTSTPRITLRGGTTIPQLGFGTLALQPDWETAEADVEATAKTVAQALEAGYRHIDTAQSYGNEQAVGRAIAACGIPRDDLYITSKLATSNHAPDDVRRSFDQTLQNLGLEQLDLFLIHWPAPTLYDGDYVSTWQALIELVAEGRLHSAGVSNFQPAHLDRIVEATGIAPALNQFEIHPYFPNRTVREASMRHGVAIEAYCPLGHNREPLTDPAITHIAGEHGKSTAQIILRWHIQHDHIAIPKSSRREHMRENIDIFDFELTPDEMRAIDALDRGPSGRVGPHPDTHQG